MDLLVLSLILAIATAFTAAQQNMGNISLRGCPTSCGDIDVPYPFGFTLGCYRPGFKLICTTSYNTTRLFIGSSLIGIEVTFISHFNNHLFVSVPFIVSAQDGVSRNTSWATTLVGTPYTISSEYNNLTATGCGVVASLLNPDTGATVTTCASICGREGINNSSCDIGFGCCWASIPPGLRTYSIQLDSPETDSGGGVAAVMANDNYFADYNNVGAGTLKGSTRVAVVLDWVISDAPSCKVAKQDLSSYACLNYSRCKDMPEGYICDCESKLDDGNPYVPNSCPVAGKIVVCVPEEGKADSRTDKAIMVKYAGGVGMILVDPINVDIARDYVVPTVVLGSDESEFLFKYIASKKNPVATISKTRTIISKLRAPEVAVFSSRGPNIVTPDIIKPDVTAPGLNILAAWSPVAVSITAGRSLDHFIVSGTSMACPHASAAAAIGKASHPGWSPSTIMSALMTTGWLFNFGFSCAAVGNKLILTDPLD